MRPIHSTGRRRAVLIGAALAICLTLPAAASAATPGGGTAQVTIGTSVHVAAKVAAVVDVSFTCDPFLVTDPATGTLVESTIGHLADGGVTLTQASGKSVAVASASFDNATVVCDGVTRHTSRWSSWQRPCRGSQGRPSHRLESRSSPTGSSQGMSAKAAPSS